MHERIGDWLLKQEDEAKPYSNKVFILERAYESYILKKIWIYLLLVFIICLAIIIVFTDPIVEWLCLLIFFMTGLIAAIIVSRKHMSEGEEYARIFVDKRLGKGQYNKIIHKLHSRSIHK